MTVIVVNFNGGDFLRKCMASLALQTFTDFEVILVDNASTDGSVGGLVEIPLRTTILREAVNHGFAVANNLAVDKSRAKWIALLNPDAEAETTWLEALMRAVAERPTHRVVASLQIAMHDASILDGAGDCYLAYGYAWRGGFGRSIDETPLGGECFAPCGAAALYPRDTFVECGGFDPRYFCYHEDVDLGFKLRWLGEKCQFAPEACVRHVGSGIVGRASDFAVFHGARNGLWTYVKNMPTRLLVITLPIWLVGTVAILGRGLVTGRFSATARGLAAAVKGIGPAFADRRRLKRLRKARVTDIILAVSWNPFRFLTRKPDVRHF
ncbi:MAG: glycosyltransferase family 2 protein [Hyphomonadaceae bacterium]